MDRRRGNTKHPSLKSQYLPIIQYPSYQNVFYTIWCVYSKNGFTPNQWVLYGFDLLSFFQKAFGRSFNHVQSHQSVIYPIIQVFQVISTCFFFFTIWCRIQSRSSPVLSVHAPACLCTSVTPPLSSDQLSSVESVRGGGQRPRGRSGAGESWILENLPLSYERGPY